MKEKSAKKKKKSIYNRILSYLSGFTGSIKAVAIAVVILVIVASGIFVAVNSGNIKIGESQASFSQEYSMSSQLNSIAVITVFSLVLRTVCLYLTKRVILYGQILFQ